MAELIRAEDVEPRRWRNRGGYTRELLVRPATDPWDMRISVAEIDADGPFSSFDGVERWMVVIAGDGVALTFSDRERQLAPGDAPICFDGATAPDCRLLHGPTRDLNLMLRGRRGAMRPVRSAVAWKEDFATRGLFAASAGHWTGDGETCDVPAMTLLWADHSVGRDWTFEYEKPTEITRAWWLGSTP